jgi:Domain of unknown function (DUF4261)
MGVMERFFGKGDPGEGGPAANTDTKNRLSLQLLFAGDLAANLDPRRLTRTLRSAHPSLAQAVFEIDDQTAAQGTPLGLAGWGDHVVQFVGFSVPMPKEVVERCVQPAHYGQALKQQARAHKAHALLYYGGREEDPLEQYVALAVVAGTLGAHGALVVLNEAAHTSFPAQALAPGRVEGDLLENLRGLPIPVLYGGFVKYNLPDSPDVWMRTYGNHLLGLPDLAFRAKGHDQGEWVFNTFSNILTYLRESGARFGVGHTMQVGDDTYLKLRAPRKEEYFLESDGELFVAELITADQVNRR